MFRGALGIYDLSGLLEKRFMGQAKPFVDGRNSRRKINNKRERERVKIATFDFCFWLFLHMKDSKNIKRHLDFCFRRVFEYIFHSLPLFSPSALFSISQLQVKLLGVKWRYVIDR